MTGHRRRSPPKKDSARKAKAPAKDAAPHKPEAASSKAAVPAAKPAAEEVKGTKRAAADASTTKLHVGKLTRNVTQEHVREIFATFGALKNVDLSIDRAVSAAAVMLSVSCQQLSSRQNFRACDSPRRSARPIRQPIQ